MRAASQLQNPLKNSDRFFINGMWTVPSSSSVFDVRDSATELLYYQIAEAQPADIDRAVSAARYAFDKGPWPQLSHAERADYLLAIGQALESREEELSEVWTRQSGILHTAARSTLRNVPKTFRYYASLANDFPFAERATPSSSDAAFGLLVREPVGVVAAIVPWNGPLALACHKLAPALLAGCTAIIKASPEAPGEAYILAEEIDKIGLPPGVVNVLTADREVSELLVRDPRVDKIAFTGSTAAGRRIASLCGERIARYTLELGGKSAAVVLDDADISATAATLASAECFLSGQVCSSLTRIIVNRRKQDALVDALASEFSACRVGDPFDESSQLGPLAMERQLVRVQSLIAKGIEEGAVLAAGGHRPKHLDRGYFFEPTVFGNVDNRSTIAREEIFGPVLSVIAADDEDDAVDIANDTIYGLNASVFTNDAQHAMAVARRLRSGTVGHNAVRTDFGIAFGGFKQSGVGREGGREGLLPYLETKTVILQDVPGREYDGG